MKNLPIGVSTFESLVTSGDLYVDKTEAIYQLVKGKGAKRYFLSRPRRFGKSLTCSTLEAIFSGRKELFKDLWIGKSDFEWKERPIVYFDFSEIAHQTPQALVQGLSDVLNFYAERYDISLHKTGLTDRFAELILKIGEAKGPIAIIVDEYDKPLIDLVDNIQLADQSRNELRAFCGALKGKSVDANMHFLFVTGVSKFSKISLFSELNNLVDLTNDERAAALVGYTDAEVDSYLQEHIQAFANKRKEDYQQTRQALKMWYNGYRFSNANITAYNPFSLHTCLTQGMLLNFWFTSGTPDVLMKYIAKNPLIASQIENIDNSFIAQSNLDSFSIDVYYQKYRTLLLQTGYLTFCSGYDADRNGYMVSYPNREVRLSMTEQIMEFVGHITPEEFGEFSKRFTKALASDDLMLFCKHLQDFIKLVPYNIRVDREMFYQQIFYMVCILFGNRSTTAEFATSEGRIDLFMEGDKNTYVLEFKYNGTSQEALEQIEAKRYWERFEILNYKKVMLGGITFNEQKDKGVLVLCETKELELAER